MWSSPQQHQYHQGTCCKYSSFHCTPDLLNHRLWGQGSAVHAVPNVQMVPVYVHSRTIVPVSFNWCLWGRGTPWLLISSKQNLRLLLFFFTFDLAHIRYLINSCLEDKRRKSFDFFFLNQLLKARVSILHKKSEALEFWWLLSMSRELTVFLLGGNIEDVTAVGTKHLWIDYVAILRDRIGQRWWCPTWK